MNQHSKTVIVIGGPTAAGKTAVALRLAQHLGCSIISCDSRQCYREMKIGVARPSEQELAAVPHYFIASHSIHEEVNAAVFESYALDVCRRLFETSDHVVMVGGTGLYIRAFAEGLDDMPPVPPEVRASVWLAYETQGLPWLQAAVAAEDPAFWEKAEQQNPQRLMRALEVVRATGRSVTSFRTGKKAVRPFTLRYFAVGMERPALYERINQRVDEMMRQGLADEVRGLYAHRHVNALQTVGYKELFDCFDGQTDLATAVEKIKQHTRQYAKRQLTWFRNAGHYTWVGPDAPVQQFL